MLAARAAAALLLIGGASYGVSPALRPGTGPAPVLTAVNGCAGLLQADGTLEQVNAAAWSSRRPAASR